MKLEVRSISKEYKNKIALQDVSLEVVPGEIVGLLGPNGAGKTTCFKIIAGLLEADKGEVVLNGENITSKSLYARGQRGISYLPQESSIFTGLTVEENVMAILELSTKAALRNETLTKLLKEFNLSKLAKQKASSLSGGEKRRLEIARLIVNKPYFVLLDEPLAGVDPVAVGEVKNLINKLKEQNIGVLITDHNVREKLAIIDRGYVIYNGITLVSGTKNVILEHDLTKKIYLGDNFN